MREGGAERSERCDPQRRRLGALGRAGLTRVPWAEASTRMERFWVQAGDTGLTGAEGVSRGVRGAKCDSEGDEDGWRGDGAARRQWAGFGFGAGVDSG